WISNQASNNGVQFGALYNTSNVGFSTDRNPPPNGAPTTSYAIAVTDHAFKYPQVVKTSLAIDKKFPGDWIVTLEGVYSKDINAVYYQNLNLRQTNAYQLAGVDNRDRYTTATTASIPSSNTSNKYYYANT